MFGLIRIGKHQRAGWTSHGKPSTDKQAYSESGLVPTSVPRLLPDQAFICRHGHINCLRLYGNQKDPMNKRLATPTNHLSESLKNLQGTKKMVWFEFQMNGRCTTLLKPKGRHLITLFKNCFLFSRNHKLPWRHEYERVFWHFFLWPWLWLSFLCFQPEQEPDKSSLYLNQRSNMFISNKDGWTGALLLETYSLPSTGHCCNWQGVAKTGLCIMSAIQHIAP